MDNLPLPPSIGMLQMMLVLVLGVMLELSVTRSLRPRANDETKAAARLWTWPCAPLLRGIVIVSAVLWTYPALFGFRVAPPLAQLLPADGARGALLLGLVLFGRLLAPLIAALGRRPALVDCLQGMLAVAVVFEGFAKYLGALSASVWPGLAAVIALVAMSVLLPALAAGLGRDFATRWSSGLAEWLGQSLAMAAVAAIVTLYGYLLGMQVGM